MRRAVPGKDRVHELAKELGITSKDVLAKLKEQGEFVKSASSTVEAPVARRLREALSPATGNGGGNGGGAPAADALPPAHGRGGRPGRAPPRRVAPRPVPARRRSPGCAGRPRRRPLPARRVG